MQSNDDFLLVDEAARLTGFSHWSIRRWLSESPPKLTRYKIGARTVINRAELLELVKPQKVEVRREQTAEPIEREGRNAHA